MQILPFPLQLLIKRKFNLDHNFIFFIFLGQTASLAADCAEHHEGLSVSAHCCSAIRRSLNLQSEPHPDWPTWCTKSGDEDCIIKDRMNYFLKFLMKFTLAIASTQMIPNSPFAYTVCKIYMPKIQLPLWNFNMMTKSGVG